VTEEWYRITTFYIPLLIGVALFLLQIFSTDDNERELYV